MDAFVSARDQLIEPTHIHIPRPSRNAKTPTACGPSASCEKGSEEMIAAVAERLSVP
jgi:hypothetical protein